MRVVTSAAFGVFAGAVFCAGTFVLGALVDRTGVAEALGFGLIVAIVGALLGGLVGAIVGVGRLRPFGGAAAGLLVALAVVAFYVVVFSREGQTGYFLSESRVIVAGLTVPLIMTGTLVSWLRIALEQRREQSL